MKPCDCNTYTVFCIDEKPTQKTLRKIVIAIGGPVRLLELCGVDLVSNWDGVLYDGPLGVIEAEPYNFFKVAS
jgi:hypothetical protein